MREREREKQAKSNGDFCSTTLVCLRQILGPLGLISCSKNARNSSFGQERIGLIEIE